MKEENDSSKEIQRISRDLYNLKIRVFLHGLLQTLTFLIILGTLALIQDRKSSLTVRVSRVSSEYKPTEEKQDGSAQENSGDLTVEQRIARSLAEALKQSGHFSNISVSGTSRLSDQLE